MNIILRISTKTVEIGILTEKDAISAWLNGISRHRLAFQQGEMVIQRGEMAIYAAKMPFQITTMPTR